MHLWSLSNPEATGSLLAGLQARNAAIAQAGRLSALVLKYVVVTSARVVVDRTRSLLRAIERESECRRSVAALRGLDDRMLRDMGITRGEIVGVVEGRLHRRPASLAELRELPRPGLHGAAPASRSENLPKAA